jgi:5-methylcytosine-specific restriction protein B
MGIGSLLSLRAAFTDRIIPLLQEYFYGDWAKIGMVLGQSFVKRSSAGIGWPEGFEGDGEAAAAESWAITDSEGWDAAAFVSIYR